MIVIPIVDYKEYIELSKARKAKYYKKGGAIPKKYSSSLYNKDGYLLDKQGNLVLKNPKAVGTPKRWKINGQALYSGTLNHFARKKAAEQMHIYFRDYIKKYVKKPIILKEDEYLMLECQIHAPINVMNWDCSNKWPYIKWFEDTLVELNKIPDDSVEYIRSSGTIKYFESEQPIMKFIIKKIDKNHNEI